MNFDNITPEETQEIINVLDKFPCISIENRLGTVINAINEDVAKTNTTQISGMYNGSILLNAGRLVQMMVDGYDDHRENINKSEDSQELYKLKGKISFKEIEKVDIEIDKLIERAFRYGFYSGVRKSVDCNSGFYMD